MVAVEALAIDLVAYPIASPINSKFTLVSVPHVPEDSPVPISLSLKSLTYVAIL